MFKDRYDAGSKLSEVLSKYANENPLILPIPRGGIVTAYDTIEKNNFDWDLIIPRKIGAPHNHEIAIGAVTSDGNYILNERYIEELNVSSEYIKNEIKKETQEIKNRLKKYKANEDFPDVENRTVIIIDDGIATGFTILAAIKSLKQHNCLKIILAVPVAPNDTVLRLNDIVDEVVCLHIPLRFQAVGYYYNDFRQTTDDEVYEIISKLKK